MAPRETVEVRHVEPMSVGRVVAAVYGALGLIGLVLTLPFLLLGVGLGGWEGPWPLGSLGFSFAMVLAPVAYAVIGFIGGLVAALVYNWVAGVTGGIRLRLR